MPHRQKIPFEVIDKQPRCSKCFSISHRSSICISIIGELTQSRESIFPWASSKGNRSHQEHAPQPFSFDPVSQRPAWSPSPMLGHHITQGVHWTPLGPTNTPPRHSYGAHLQDSPPSLSKIPVILMRHATGLFEPEDVIKLMIYQATQLQTTY